MKKMIILFLLLPISFFAQHENDNWIYGNSKLHFDNSGVNGFTQTIRSSPYIRYISSVISDKTTGELLFYSDGYRVYNRNNQIMPNGNHLFGTGSYPYIEFIGNSSDQSSIILPKPGSNHLYYLFYINGGRSTNDHELGSPNSYNLGLRYAIIDMSLNSGLGDVISKNNILFTNSGNTSLSSTFASDGSSYWVLTRNSNNPNSLFSYKLDSNGLNTTPVVSAVNSNFSFIKISPNASKVALREYGKIRLYDFNNSTGVLSNGLLIVNNIYYSDSSNSPNSLEFSEDGNILYFISSLSCLCLYPTPAVIESGISMYNISTGSLVGTGGASYYLFPLLTSNNTASLQRAKNGKIYLIHNYKQLEFPDFYYIFNFGSINSPYNWGVINNPNTWNPTVSPLSFITPNANTKHGFSFPQLIPIHTNSNLCVQDIVLTTVENNNNYTYNASNSITTHTNYQNIGKNIDFKAGNFINLLPNTLIEPNEVSVFTASIENCINAEIVSKKSTINSSTSKVDYKLNDENGIKVYPNPTSSFVKIDLANQTLKNWVLYDQSGKQIKSGNKDFVDFEGIIQGTYILAIETNKLKLNKKIIKK